MKRYIPSLLLIVIVMSLFVGCQSSTHKTHSSSEQHSYVPSFNNTDENTGIENDTSGVSKKAEIILNSLSDQPRVDDFKKIHKILTNLSNNQDIFLKQLNDAQKIYTKYNSSLEQGDYFLNRPDTISITQDEIDGYIDNRIDSEIYAAITDILYPTLIDTYGSHINNVRGLTKRNFSNVNGSFSLLDDTKTTYDTTTEVWKNPNYSNLGSVTIKYFPNNCLKSIEFPIIISDNQMDLEELKKHVDTDIEYQTDYTNKQISSMLESFDTFSLSKEYLDIVFSDEELYVLENFIKSLTVDYIREYDFFTFNNVSAPNNPTLILRYKDVYIDLSFNINNVYLKVEGNKEINGFSNAYYILLCNYLGDYWELYTYEKCKPYVDFDLSRNVFEWAVDLDSYTLKSNNGSIVSDLGNNVEHWREIFHIPPNIEISVIVGSEYYWEAGNCELLPVSIYNPSGDLLACADLDVYTHEMKKNIYLYTGAYNVTLDEYYCSETDSSFMIYKHDSDKHELSLIFDSDCMVKLYDVSHHNDFNGDKNIEHYSGHVDRDERYNFEIMYNKTTDEYFVAAGTGGEKIFFNQKWYSGNYRFKETKTFSTYQVESLTLSSFLVKKD